MKFAYAAVLLVLLAACERKVEAVAQPAGPPPAPVANSRPMPPLTAEGWGPIEINMTNAQASAQIARLRPDGPHDEDWLACHTLSPAAVDGIWIMVEEDRVTRVAIDAPGVKTDMGIGVGSTEAAVRAAYPTGLVQSPHKYEGAPAKYLTWWEKPGKAGIRFTIGAKGLVDHMSGGSGSIELAELFLSGPGGWTTGAHSAETRTPLRTP